MPESVKSQSKPGPQKSPAYRPRFKPHFPQVLAFIYLSRYATAYQVQARLPESMGEERTCRRHLKQLRDAGYLGVVDVRSAGGAHQPLVYICSAKGTQFLRDHFGWELVEAREEAKTLWSIEHELALTEFEVACWEFVTGRADLDVLFTERRYMHESKRLVAEQVTAAGKSEKVVVVPDAGFLLRQQRADRPQPACLLYFVEHDQGTEKGPKVLDKFRKYTSWCQSPAGQGYLLELYRRYGVVKPKVTFRLLFVTRHDSVGSDDGERLADVVSWALELPEGMVARMWFTTVSELAVAAESDQPTLGQAVWVTGHDARAWRSEYLTFASQRMEGKRSRPSWQHKRAFVRERLAAMPRRVVFPAEALP